MRKTISVSWKAWHGDEAYELASRPLGRSRGVQWYFCKGAQRFLRSDLEAFYEGVNPILRRI